MSHAGFAPVSAEAQQFDGGSRSLLAGGRYWHMNNGGKFVRPPGHKGRKWMEDQFLPKQAATGVKIIKTKYACLGIKPDSTGSIRAGSDCKIVCRKACTPYYTSCGFKEQELFTTYCRADENPKVQKPVAHKLCTCRCNHCNKAKHSIGRHVYSGYLFQ